MPFSFNTLNGIFGLIPQTIVDVENTFTNHDGKTKKQHAMQLIMDGLGLATNLLPDKANAIEDVAGCVSVVVDETVKLFHAIGEFRHKPPAPTPPLTPAQQLQQNLQQQATGASDSGGH